MLGVGSWIWVQIDWLIVLIRRMKNLILDCLLVQIYWEESLLVSCCVFYWNMFVYLFYLLDVFFEGMGKLVIDFEEGEFIELGILLVSVIQVGSQCNSFGFGVVILIVVVLQR